MHQLNSLIIYSDRLLQPSQTFIKSQAEALTNFEPYYAGARRDPKGLKLPSDRVAVVNQGNRKGMLNELLFRAFQFSPCFEQKLRQQNPCLMHAHFGTGGVALLHVARHLQVPLIVTFHGFDATITDEYARKSFYSHRVYLKRREELKRDAQLFIAVSDFIRNKLLEQGFPEEKIVQHYIGVDTALFNPDPAIPREPVVLFVGRLVEKKGCEYLIRAMEQVQAKLPEARLVVIGSGNLRPDLENLARNKLVNYEFLGTQSSDVVKRWLNRSKVFCVPSITAESGDSEAFGIVFAEAQAMGVPVVSFDHGGIGEAVAHGKTGLLAPERDWETLGNYILQVLSCNTTWQEFSNQGQQWVRANFDLKQQTQQLEYIYQQTIASA